MRSDRVRMICSVALEAFITVAVPVAWCIMVFNLSDSGLLSAVGLSTLKYFTVQSNLFAAAASLLTMIGVLRAWKTGGRLPSWLIAVRIVSAAGLMLTMLTVLAFLGPLFGYAAMFRGANLWFHGIVPVASAAGVLLLRGERMGKGSMFLSLLPVGAYSIWYLGNILINGVGTRPNSNDWYNLLNWGVGVGLFLFAGLIGIILGSCVVLRLIYNRISK